jgi:hypothetical protein
MGGIFLMTNFSTVMYGIFLMTLTRSSDVRYFSDDFNAHAVMYGIFLMTLTHSNAR